MAPRLELDPDDGVLTVEGDDGHQSSYRLETLRRLCPCAVCREQNDPTDPLPVRRVLPPEAIRLDRMELVGNYGIALIWGDGHRTGIYSWDLLRDHCGCLACRLAREGGSE